MTVCQGISYRRQAGVVSGNSLALHSKCKDTHASTPRWLCCKVMSPGFHLTRGHGKKGCADKQTWPSCWGYWQGGLAGKTLAKWAWWLEFGPQDLKEESTEFSLLHMHAMAQPTWTHTRTPFIQLHTNKIYEILVWVRMAVHCDISLSISEQLPF